MARKTPFSATLPRLREGRWSRANAELLLDELERSGRSTAEFAAEHDLNVKKLYWWRSQLARPYEQESELESVSFAPVVVTGMGRERAVAVVRRGSLEIEVFDPDAVTLAWVGSMLRVAKFEEGETRSHVELDVHELSMLLEGLELGTGRASTRWEPTRHA